MDDLHIQEILPQVFFWASKVMCCSVLQCVAVCCSALMIYIAKESCLRIFIYFLALSATHICGTPQHTATKDVCCSVLQSVAECCGLTCYILPHVSFYLRHSRAATHCNSLQHTTTPCKILQRAAVYCNILQRMSSSL